MKLGVEFLPAWKVTGFLRSTSLSHSVFKSKFQQGLQYNNYSRIDKCDS